MENKTVFAFDIANELDGIGNTIAVLFMSIKENESIKGSYYAERITQSLFATEQHIERIAEELRSSVIASEVE